MLACSSLLIATAALVQASPPLGRLFHTPEQRQELDRQRSFTQRVAPAASAEHRFTVNGIVTRSSGRKTLWINHTPLSDGRVDADLLVSASPDTPSRVLIQGPPFMAVTTRVGETFDRSSGAISDLLGGGRITLGHPQYSGDAHLPAR